jgi:hypothetical protein
MFKNVVACRFFVLNIDCQHFYMFSNAPSAPPPLPSAQNDIQKRAHTLHKSIPGCTDGGGILPRFPLEHLLATFPTPHPSTPRQTYKKKLKNIYFKICYGSIWLWGQTLTLRVVVVKCRPDTF